MEIRCASCSKQWTHILEAVPQDVPALLSDRWAIGLLLVLYFVVPILIGLGLRILYRS